MSTFLVLCFLLSLCDVNFEFHLNTYCHTFQEPAENNCVYRNEIHHSAAERTQVLQDVAADPTLPRTKSVRCSQCGHGEAVFFQVIFICLCFLLYLGHKCLHITAFISFFTNMPEFLVSVAGTI